MPSLGQLGGALAGGSVIGGAVVKLILDDSEFSAKLNADRAQVQGAAGGIGGAFSQFSGAAQVAMVAAAGAVIKFGIDSVKAFNEAQQVAAQTNAVLASTGGQAGVTATQVAALADTIRNYSGVDDEAVQASENLLLTFRAVQNQAGAGNDIFNQSTMAIVDMATALNEGAVPSMEDLHSATLQLGKALNDPIVGLTALRRVGVSFSASQSETIKGLAETGHLLEAQKAILAEVEKEFGGAAKAAGQTLAGQLAILGSKFHDVEEEVGAKLAPALTELVGAFNKLLPLVGAAAGGAFSVLADAVAAFATEAGVAADSIARLVTLIPKIGSSGGNSVAGVMTLGDAIHNTVDSLINTNAPGLRWIEMASKIGSTSAQTSGLVLHLGVSISGAASKVSQAATAMGNFAHMSATDFQKWQETASQSLNLVEASLSDLASSAHVTASSILHAFEEALHAEQQFGKNSQRFLGDVQQNFPKLEGGAQQLVAKLATMGADGARILAALAGASKSQMRQIIQDFIAGGNAADQYTQNVNNVPTKHDTKITAQDAASSVAKTVTNAVTGIPIKHITNITANGNQAIGEAHAVAAALNAVPNQIVSTITTISKHIIKTVHGASGGIFPMATGGITQGPVYQFGEAGYSTFAGRGAEAVIPLNDRGISVLSKAIQRAGGGVGGRGVNVTINTQGAMDPDQLAASVSRHLSRTIREEALV